MQAEHAACSQVAENLAESKQKLNEATEAVRRNRRELASLQDTSNIHAGCSTILGRTSTQLITCKSELAALEQEKESLNSEYNECQQIRAAQDNQIAHLERDCTEQQVQNASLDQSWRNLADQLAATEQQMTYLEEDRSWCREKLEILWPKYQELQGSRNECFDGWTIAEEECRALETKLVEANTNHKAKIVAKRSEIARLRSQLASATNDTTTACEATRKLDSEKTALQRKLDMLTTNLAAASRELFHTQAAAADVEMLTAQQYRLLATAKAAVEKDAVYALEAAQGTEADLVQCGYELQEITYITDTLRINLEAAQNELSTTQQAAIDAMANARYAMQELEADLIDSDREVQEMRLVAGSLQDDLTVIQLAHRVAQDELAAAEITAHQAAIESGDLQQSLDAANADTSAIYMQLINAQETAIQLQQEVAAAQQENFEAGNAMDNAQTEIRAHQATVAELQHDLRVADIEVDSAHQAAAGAQDQHEVDIEALQHDLEFDIGVLRRDLALTKDNAAVSGLEFDTNMRELREELDTAIHNAFDAAEQHRSKFAAIQNGQHLAEQTVSNIRRSAQWSDDRIRETLAMIMTTEETWQ